MSRRLGWLGCVALVACLPSARYGQDGTGSAQGVLGEAPPLSSQQAVSEREARQADLRTKLSSLEGRIRAAKLRADEADAQGLLEANSQISDLDTLQLGPLTIVSRSNRSAEADRAFRRALTWYQAPLAGLKDLERFIVFEIGPQPGRLGIDRPVVVWTREGANDLALEDAVAGGLSRSLRQVMPAELAEWMGTGAPVDPSAGDQRKLVYREMATKRSKAVKDCLDNEISRCWQAMGVLEGDGDPGHIWYSDAERRQSAMDWSYGNGIGRIENLAECEAGDVQACDRVLRKVAPWPVEPLTQQARVSLVSYALERGGAGSFHRLVTTDGSIADRIASASHLSADALMEEWLQFLRKDFASSKADMAGTLLTMLVWVGLLAFVGTASTRWRFS